LIFFSPFKSTLLISTFLLIFSTIKSATKTSLPRNRNSAVLFFALNIFFFSNMLLLPLEKTFIIHTNLSFKVWGKTFPFPSWFYHVTFGFDFFALFITFWLKKEKFYYPRKLFSLFLLITIKLIYVKKKKWN